MRNIIEVREIYNECPRGHGREHIIFQNESVHCEICHDDWDLGMKKYK